MALMITLAAAVVFARVVGTWTAGDAERWWRDSYGPTRSVRTVEQLSLTLWVVVGVTLVGIVTFGGVVHPAIRRLSMSWAGIGLGLASLAYVHGFLSGFGAFDDGAPTPEASWDHDGVSVTMRSRRTGPHITAAAAYALLPPLGSLVSRLLRLRSPQTATIEIRPAQVRITRGRDQQRIPLHGTEVTLVAASDGTPLLVLKAEAQRVETPLGGTPINHVRWLVTQIRDAAGRTDGPLPEPPMPDALRDIVDRTPE